MRWPEGPPHLALNPPCMLFHFLGGILFFPFLSLPLNTKNFFPIEKGIFCLFLSLSLWFSLACFGLPLFQFLFLCLSLVLFCFFFLLVFVFCFLLVPYFCLFIFVSSLLLFHKRTNIKALICNCYYSIFYLFWFPVFLYICYFLLFWVRIPFPYVSFVFPDFKLCFLFNINVFWFENKQLQKPQCFGQEGGCNKTFFVYQPVFCKM